MDATTARHLATVRACGDATVRACGDRDRNRDRDDEAFRDLVTTYRTSLLAYALRLTRGDRTRAEDAVQETFIRAWHHLPRLTPGYGSVNGWLRRVTHNLVMDTYRGRAGRTAETELDAAGTTPAADATRQVLDRLLVHQALARLCPGHRAALVEVYLHGKTAAEAA